MYIFNESRVFADFADDQYVILNYVTGAYYAFTKASSAVLRALTQGCDAADVKQWFESLYGAECSASDKVDRFTEKLESLEIVVRDDGREGKVQDYLSSINGSEMPELDFEVFTDVADLLLMDPIHEVDEEAGWPIQKE